MKFKKMFSVFTAIFIMLGNIMITNVSGYDSESNYMFASQAPITYTYRKEVYLYNYKTYSFYTGQSSDFGGYDTELFLFKKTESPGNNSWYNDDISSSNHFSKIDVAPTESGIYILMAKKYTVTDHCGYCPDGYCNVYQDTTYNNETTTVCLKSNAKLGGYEITRASLSSKMYNSFTANLSSSSVDPVMIIINKETDNRTVNGYNDDFPYDSTTSDFNWGKHSRVEKYYSSGNKKTVFVSAFSESTEGYADIYAFCKDKYGDYSYPAYFPDYKMIDRINSADNNIDYNCIAFSGGIINQWIKPEMKDLQNVLLPWYNSNNVIALDNFYGNNPPRYSGAMTYEVTTNENDAIVNVYQNGNEWTHASVRENANYQRHGYAWESKLGGSYRVFHALHSLDNDTANRYGHIARMYKASTNNSNGLTMEESINLGYTTFQEIDLTNDEISFLTEKTELISSEIYDEFLSLYSNWVEKNEADEVLHLTSDYINYYNTEEYRLLSEYINNNENLLYAIMNMYLEKGYDIYLEALIGDQLVTRNNDTLLLAEQIREENNKISTDSIKDEVYIAPSIDTNIRCFIKEILNKGGEML